MKNIKPLAFHLDPRTKVFLMIVVSIVALMGYQGMIFKIKPWYSLLPFLLYAMNGKIWSALKSCLIFLLAAFFDKWMFFLPDSGFWRDIVRLLAALISMFLPCFAMGSYIINTTKVSEYIAAMQNMHVSPKIVIPFLVLFRFFPTVKEEYYSIKNAMKMRGITLKNGPVAMLEYRFVPLIISLVKIGDDLSAAASARGLSANGKRTNVCELYWTIWDFLFILISLAVLVIFAFSLAIR